MRSGVAIALGWAVAAAACRPALDDHPWLITAPRIVAWKAEPPEANPGAAATLEAFVLDPAGPSDASAAAWSWCTIPKPLAENRPLAADCLAPPAADAIGDPVELTIPIDACRLFGPDTPQPAPGAPATRPRDPDATGGYYQPITIALGASLAVGLERVGCDLPDASFAVARAFQAAYRPNTNPAIAGLAFTIEGAPADPAAIPRGARVTVEASWPDGGAETFPIFDRASRALVTTMETLSAAWYVTGGSLDRAADEITDAAASSTATVWTAPAQAATVEMLFALRDSRGGSDVARATLTVP